MSNHPPYLLQEVPGQKPYVYEWTAVLAKKEHMRPISEEEARPLLRVQQGKRPLKTDKPEEPKEATKEEREDNKILDDLSAEKTSPIDGEAKPLEVTQNDILARDMEKIKRLRVKSSIESYMLKKYEVPMIQMETVEDMRLQAADILKALAAQESLHE